jgi:hypothetical protein
MGYAEEDIVIDVVVDSSMEIGTVDVSNYNAFEMAWRAIEVT